MIPIKIRESSDTTAVVVSIGTTTTVGELAEGIFDRPDSTIRVVDRRLTFAAEDLIQEVDLRPGDEIERVGDEGRLLADGKACDYPAAYLRGQSGPFAGRIFLLTEGCNVVGRSDGCDVVLRGDPKVSRRQLQIQVGDLVTMAELSSKNRVAVNGLAPAQVSSIQPDDRLTIGESDFIVVRRNSDATRLRNAVGFNRPPRVVPPYKPKEFRLPRPPDKPRKQRLPMATAAGPLVIASALALLTGFNWMTFIFYLMSPVLAGFSYIESLHNGRKDLAEAIVDWEGRVRKTLRSLEQQQRLEYRRRHFESPDLSELTLALDGLTDRLWERRPDHPDYLDVRAAVGPRPSRHPLQKADPGGHDPLVERIRDLPNRYKTVKEVPIVIPWAEVGSVGVTGDAGRADRVDVPSRQALETAYGLVLQLALLHSPAELVIAGLFAEDAIDDWDWLKWLPHVRVPSSPLGTVDHLAAEPASRLEVLASLNSLLGGRLDTGDGDSGQLGATVLVVLDERHSIETSRLSDLLEHGPAANLLVLRVAHRRDKLQNSLGCVVSVGDSDQATVEFVDLGETVPDVVPVRIDRAAAELQARALAPIIDTTRPGAADGTIPQSIDLTDLLGSRSVLDCPDELLARWANSDSLGAVVGARGGGSSLELDIRHDGPHGLVAGTTGSGKSEFLQSMIASLALAHPPNRLTFLLVDYKGGAAFKDCQHLTHTVGMVTDLDPHLVRRALTSLNAEIHRRERLLNKAGAKDLAEMEKMGHPDSPPSMIIVVDEFAALRTEVPEFVDGVVDIAQRGRSLGLHLILATQRPAGVITPNILANTNLRIALRVSDASESTDVIGRPDAAGLNRSTPGRGLVRLGHDEIEMFQSAYVGGHSITAVPSSDLRIDEFKVGPRRNLVVPTPPVVEEGAPTDLERIVWIVDLASEAAGMPPPRRPWLPELGAVYDLLELTSTDGLTVGCIDEPERQIQRTAVIDLATVGHLMVYGTSGAGKSVLLRTLACGAALSEEPITVYGLDFAGRELRMLEHLPHVACIAEGDDHQRVTRTLRALSAAEIDSRSEGMAQVSATDLSEYRSKDAERRTTPRILVLLDGLLAFLADYDKVDGGRWVDLLPKLISDGRQAGVHFVLSAERRTGIPMRITSLVSSQIVLRLANNDEYSAADVPADAFSNQSPAGRASSTGMSCRSESLEGTGRVLASNEP